VFSIPFIDVPGDAAAIASSGFVAIGSSGPTSARPSNAKAGAAHIDTTLGFTVSFDGTNWRNPISGAVVVMRANHVVLRPVADGQMGEAGARAAQKFGASGCVGGDDATASHDQTYDHPSSWKVLEGGSYLSGHRSPVTFAGLSAVPLADGCTSGQKAPGQL
jgi:hypothetical protein